MTILSFLLLKNHEFTSGLTFGEYIVLLFKDCKNFSHSNEEITHRTS